MTFSTVDDTKPTMSSGILLASPRLRAHLRRKRIREQLTEFRRMQLSPEDEGYLRLAETVLLADETPSEGVEEGLSS